MTNVMKVPCRVFDVGDERDLTGRFTIQIGEKNTALTVAFEKKSGGGTVFTKPKEAADLNDTLAIAKSSGLNTPVTKAAYDALVGLKPTMYIAL